VSTTLPFVFIRAQALAAGMPARQIDARVRSGQWTALRRGVYAETTLLPADAVERHAADVLAAVAATDQDVVASHESGAVLHQLRMFARYEGPPVLSRVRKPRTDRPNRATPAELVSQIPEEHRTTVHEAPVTTLARTAVDLARKGPALSAIVVLDSALREGASREQLREVLRVCRGWPGSVRAAEYVEFADHRAESALESVGRWRMYQLELPKPDLQVPLHDSAGFIGRSDFYFEDLQTVGEADGMLKYRSDPEEEDDAAPSEALELEKLREDRLRDAGFEVFRFTWDIAVRRPAVLEMRARRAFDRARARRRAA
jgi:hypothetical protein